jgi:hypothetical protein
MLIISCLRPEIAPVKRLGYTVHDLVHLPPSKPRRALTAFVLCVGYGLSLHEAARLLDVSVTYVAAVSRVLPEQRAQLISGTLKLSSVVNGHGRNGGCPSLIEQLKAASPAERLEAARAIGVGVIWDQMVSPICDEKPAAVE